MSSSEELNVARAKLEESLDEDTKTKYFQLLKLWFKMKSTKEEFYGESKKILTPAQFRLHNSFLLNLFNTCQFPTTSTPVVHIPKPSPSYKQSPPREKEKAKKDKSRTRKRTRSDRGFVPSDSYEMPSCNQTLPPHAMEEPLRYVHEELFLPDSSFIHGRILLCAWDHGLEGGTEAAVDYLVTAVQHFLKNILTRIFSQRSSYKVREGCFQYAMGAPLPNQWLRNSAKIKDLTKDFPITEIDDDCEEVQIPGERPTYEEMEQHAAFELACCTKPTVAKPPVSAYNLLEALLTDPSIVPYQKVYSINVERIYGRLSHPSHEELEKED